jgi:hypothetical protein
MSEWPNPNNITNSWPQPKAAEGLVAKPHCCEEASLNSLQFYIPCNNPAVSVVGWRGRNDSPVRMCAFCADHNVKNRGGYIAEPYTGPTGAGQAWPTGPTLNDVAHSLNPLDAKSEDELLMLWQQKKDAIETAKAEEMELRKYIVSRAFPAKNEGMNNKELGNGYVLKAGVKYNYNLASNDVVEDCLNHIAKLGNEGPFIADRLVGWTPSFKLTEYRLLCEARDKGEQHAINILKYVDTMLTITEAAPTLEIKEPKGKKK